MTTANRVIKNTGFLYAKMGITMFISLYTTRLILNALGAEDFGIFNIVGGAIAMLGIYFFINKIWKAGYDSYRNSFLHDVAKETTPSGGAFLLARRSQLQISVAKETTPHREW